ncbi:hypothetical protein ACQ1P6_07590 [Streptococcus pasteurianus]
MFDLWEILKYEVKKAHHWLKQNVRQFFCKHHYVEKKMLWHGVPGIYCDGVKCSKCGKTTEKEDWMTIYDEKENRKAFCNA